MFTGGRAFDPWPCCCRRMLTDPGSKSVIRQVVVLISIHNIPNEVLPVAEIGYSVMWFLALKGIYRWTFVRLVLHRGKQEANGRVQSDVSAELRSAVEIPPARP